MAKIPPTITGLLKTWERLQTVRSCSVSFHLWPCKNVQHAHSIGAVGSVLLPLAWSGMSWNSNRNAQLNTVFQVLGPCLYFCPPPANSFTVISTSLRSRISIIDSKEDLLEKIHPCQPNSALVIILQQERKSSLVQLYRKIFSCIKCGYKTLLIKYEDGLAAGMYPSQPLPSEDTGFETTSRIPFCILLSFHQLNALPSVSDGQVYAPPQEFYPGDHFTMHAFLKVGHVLVW